MCGSVRICFSFTQLPAVREDSRAFCFCHQMNQMNLMAGAIDCLVKSGSSGDDFYDSGISVIRWLPSQTMSAPFHTFPLSLCRKSYKTISTQT